MVVVVVVQCVGIIDNCAIFVCLNNASVAAAATLCCWRVKSTELFVTRKYNSSHVKANEFAGGRVVVSGFSVVAVVAAGMVAR